MKTSELAYSYPDSLIATSKAKVSRVMWVEDEPQETTITNLISRFRPEDVLVVNDTKVIKARVICPSGLEVLFIRPLKDNHWEVLCPARRWAKTGEVLPCGTKIELIETGLPQIVKVERELTLSYFEQYGDMPLPPYIQQMRGERKSREGDDLEYQTSWAREPGSLAAPTASLHFSKQDLEKISARGASVVPLCLHVGLGTFLPIHSKDLSEHKMHEEWVSIPEETLDAIMECKGSKGRVWALGTTVTRALESWQQGCFQREKNNLVGSTDLFIQPGYDFKVVDILMTNFHQPESTLLALVGGFAGLEKVLSCYQWAVEREFRLFSYGDLSVWVK